MRCCRNEVKEYWDCLFVCGRWKLTWIGAKKRGRGSTTVIIMGRKPASATFYRPINQEGEGKKPIWTNGMHAASASTEVRLSSNRCVGGGGEKRYLEGENDLEDGSFPDIFFL